MKQWEDIIRDKLSGSEKTLPEGSLARFRARRDGEGAAPKRFPLVWVAASAVVTVIAAVLLLRRPEVSEAGVQIVRQPEPVVAAAPDTTGFGEPQHTAPVRLSAVSQKRLQPADELPKDSNQEKSMAEPEETVSPDDTVTVVSREEIRTGDFAVPAGSPFIPSVPKTTPVGIGEVGYAAAGVAGSSALLALLAVEPFTERNHLIDNNFGFEHLTEEPLHYMPLRLGLSVSVPVSGRLRLTGGIDYALYVSEFKYYLAGPKRQVAQYIGIPLRLDGALATNDLFDVYLGGGLGVDYCLSATSAGERIPKDGVGLSLLGAGGVQLKLSDHVGIYLEPELRWTMPTGSQVLRTFRSQHPLEFSVRSGIRINFKSK